MTYLLIITWLSLGHRTPGLSWRRNPERSSRVAVPTWATISLGRSASDTRASLPGAASIVRIKIVGFDSELRTLSPEFHDASRQGLCI